MPNKIPLYETGKLSIDPSATGEAAFQQAGRRIGPAFNEAATLTRSIAEAQASVIKQRKWPFDMLELERSLETTGGRLGGNGGIGLRLEGGVNNMVNLGEGRAKAERAARPAHENAQGADVGAHALSAATLGRIAAGMAARSGVEHNSVIDPLTGRDISAKNGRGSEGVSIIDPRTGMDITKLPQSKYDTVLDRGVLRKVDRETGKEVGGPPTGAFSGPNSDAERDANSYSRSEATGAFDPNDPQGQKNVGKFRAENGYDPNSGKFTGSPIYTGPQDNPGENNNPLGPGAPPIPPPRDAGSWWAPDTDELRRQLLPGGDSGDVTDDRTDPNIYGRDVAPQPSGNSDFGNSGGADYGGGSDAET